MLVAARREADEAVALDPALAEAWIARGICHVLDRQVAQAEAAAHRGLVLAPNAHIVITGAARIYLFTGRTEAALELARRVPVKRTVSRHPGHVIGLGAIVLGRCDEALPPAEAQLGPMPDSTLTRLILAAAYAGLGRRDDAREQSRHLSRLLHGEPLDSLAKWMLPFVDAAPRERIVGLVKSAG
jgi:Flp pilus assembly protein TadD